MTSQGADMRRETGDRWQDDAETQLREVCRSQRDEIATLRAEVDELRRRLELRDMARRAVDARRQA